MRLGTVSSKKIQVVQLLWARRMQVRDLLSKDPKNQLELKEDNDRGVFVKDLTSYVVKGYDVTGNEFRLKNSGNGVCCTHALLLLIRIILCSELHCQKVLDRNSFPIRSQHESVAWVKMTTRANAAAPHVQPTTHRTSYVVKESAHFSRKPWTLNPEP